MAEILGKWAKSGQKHSHVNNQFVALILSQSLTRRLAACFKDHRDPAFVEHTLETVLVQRVVGIALGYEVWLTMTDRRGRASRRGRRKMAAWNGDYMLQIIANQAHA